VGGWVDEWMDGWMDGWMDELMYGRKRCESSEAFLLISLAQISLKTCRISRRLWFFVTELSAR